jgi:CDP-glucose 4,6-dehydratase
MHFLISGHTGFKGAWLTLLLRNRGHEVSGFALDPVEEGLYNKSNLSNLLNGDFRQDVRDFNGTLEIFRRTQPDVFIHLAAQPLVLESYQKPVETFEINVNGTLNVIQAAYLTDSLKCQLIVTTDKVYKNDGKRNAFVETDQLGGDDPYSASKAMADILAQSWVKSFPTLPTSVGRAGNVIGGGDASANRLIPDLVKNLKLGVQPLIRHPEYVRPWQHVLDCLNGYLHIVEHMLRTGESACWNIGPDFSNYRTVENLANRVIEYWDENLGWVKDDSNYRNESEYLTLDSSKARTSLNWRDKYGFEESVQETIDWYRRVHNGEPPLFVSQQQVARFDSEV